MSDPRSLLAPCDVVTPMSVTGRLVHECPFEDESDQGQVTITWLPAGQTLELHALRDWLDGFAREKVSHEDLTAGIEAELDDLEGITDVTVSTTWQTAGFHVSAGNAVLR